MSAVYKPMVSQETCLAMAQEKVCADLDKLGDFITSLAIPPNAREHSRFFGPIASDRLITEVLLNEGATNEQLAEGMRELRRRFLTEYGEDVSKEFQRLLAQDE